MKSRRHTKLVRDIPAASRRARVYSLTPVSR